MEQKRERERERRMNEWGRWGILPLDWFYMLFSSFRLIVWILDAHFFRYLDLRHQLQHLPRLRPSEAELRTSEPRPGPRPPAAPATRISAARLVLWMRPPKQSHAWKTSSSTVKLQLLAIWKITIIPKNRSIPTKKTREKNKTQNVSKFTSFWIYVSDVFFVRFFFRIHWGHPTPT